MIWPRDWHPNVSQTSAIISNLTEINPDRDESLVHVNVSHICNNNMGHIVKSSALRDPVVFLFFFERQPVQHLMNYFVFFLTYIIVICVVHVGQSDLKCFTSIYCDTFDWTTLINDSAPIIMRLYLFIDLCI